MAVDWVHRAYLDFDCGRWPMVLIQPDLAEGVTRGAPMTAVE